jgi:hypothetical protein
MALTNVSYRDIDLLRSSPFLLGVEQTDLEKDKLRARTAHQIEEKLMEKIGATAFDRTKESNLAHKFDPSSLKADLLQGKQPAEDIKYQIDLSPQEESLLAREIEQLKSVESLIGREQFADFCLRQGSEDYKMVVTEPDKQFSLDRDGSFQFSPSISPSEVNKASKAANLLYDREAIAPIKLAMRAMEEATGKEFQEISKDSSPIVTGRIDVQQHQAIIRNNDNFDRIAKELGAQAIPLLVEYRRNGGDATLTNPRQIDIEPNEDGSLRLRGMSDESLSHHRYHDATPKDLSRWMYASQILGLSDREKKEVGEVMEEMADIHNDMGSKGRGDFNKPVKGFGDLQLNNSNNSYPVLITGEQINRKDAALDKLSSITAAFSPEEVSDLFRQQLAAGKEGNAARITDLGQITKTPSGLEIMPIQEFRGLPKEIQEARTKSIGKIAASRSGQNAVPQSQKIQSPEKKAVQMER